MNPVQGEFQDSPLFCSPAAFLVISAWTCAISPSSVFIFWDQVRNIHTMTALTSAVHFRTRLSTTVSEIRAPALQMGAAEVRGNPVKQCTGQ